jgi:chromosomal replication initiator protein
MAMPVEFVAGSENRLLAAVMHAWHQVLEADTVDPEAWHRLSSPLVLVGATGSGKSHLAADLAQAAGANRSVFVTANDLRRDFAKAIESGEAGQWRERLAKIPLVVIDDIDHLPGHSNFQQEVLHLARELEERGGKLVVTSARPIAHLEGWLADLVNWFASGLTLEIAPLGVEARRELIAELAAAYRWQFSPEAEKLLVEHSSPEPREVFRLVADLARQFGPGAKFEADTLGHFLQKRKAAQAPELRDIVRVVARYHRLPLKMLTSASRQAAVVSARATAIYLARQLTSASYEQIGQQLGGRDHTTIMHSHRQTEKRIPREAALRAAIDDLGRLLRK